MSIRIRNCKIYQFHHINKCIKYNLYFFNWINRIIKSQEISFVIIFFLIFGVIRKQVMYLLQYQIGFH